MNTKELKIEGMKCEGCVNRINNVLATVKGLIDYEVSLEAKKVTITYKNEKVVSSVIASIVKLGFDVTE